MKEFSPHFSYRFCCELPPSAPCGLLCEQAVSTSLRLLRPAPASFRPEFPLDSMFSCSPAGTARREIRSAPHGDSSSPRLATKQYEKSGLVESLRLVQRFLRAGFQAAN